jgi:general secretion pathway protein E
MTSDSNSSGPAGVSGSRREPSADSPEVVLGNAASEKIMSVLRKSPVERAAEDFASQENRNGKGSGGGLAEQIFGRKALGEILVERKKITEDQLRAALKQQSERGDKVGKILIESDLIEQNELLQTLAIQLDLPYYENLPISDIDPDLVSNISISFCTNNLIVPVSRDAFGVTVAVNDPLNVASVDDLRLILGTNINRVVCPKTTIEAAINSVFERQDMSSDAATGLADDEDTIAGLDDAHDLLHDTEEAPVRKEVSAIIRRAISERASDIHIEPFDERVSVRFRIDGRLREVRSIAKKYESSVATRIKILGKLNIAESRLPQDGRISLKVGGRECDVRVSTLPTKFGERIVMRILDKSTGIRPLEKSGMPAEVYRVFRSMIAQKHGIILVTGPTGSGKTSTLASALSAINKPDVSIITLEDPVEITIPGVGQVEVNEKAGLTFAAGLRSILRQDPNVILIGEIRDAETAQIAVQAALTGHLVLSTVHTNDTAATVTRLNDLGVEPFQITTSVIGILAVRLLRRLCITCKEVAAYSPAELSVLGIPEAEALGKKLFRARTQGCSACRNTGYNGRIGIYELLNFDDEIKNYVLKSVDGAGLRKIAVAHGITTLRRSAAERVLAGETSLEEAIYATQMEDLE